MASTQFMSTQYGGWRGGGGGGGWFSNLSEISSMSPYLQVSGTSDQN